MNNRYKFLSERDEYDSNNLVKNAFLAAQNGEDADQIVNALLTTDEMLKIGRRIQIASLISSGMTQEEIRDFLKVGKDTVTLVGKHLARYPKGFTLIHEREKKVEKEYESRAYRKTGGSKLIKKKREYTGFTRKDVKR